MNNMFLSLVDTLHCEELSVMNSLFHKIICPKPFSYKSCSDCETQAIVFLISRKNSCHFLFLTLRTEFRISWFINKTISTREAAF